ncbi:MAG: alcohol dehydrogenase catalytic domain-containing protein [Planctomycetales bacterium]|nr:alcohol dehydrogenase catalytic domain-containing protein [Planctomycetales bacterium]
MRAIVLTDEGPTFTDRHPELVPRAGEVVVRVLMAGICETDLQLIRGYMGFRGVLGHEFVGVAESGPWSGRRVVGEINCSCRTCETCRSGMPNHCPHRTVIGILNHDGAFADRVLVPQDNLHLVPDEMDSRTAVFTEPLAAAFQIPTQVSLHRDRQVVVLGDGRLGNLCAQVVRLHAARTLVIGKHDRKLALLNRLGIETARVADVTPKKFADVVVDCTGSPTGFETALRFVKPRGTIVMKTTVAGAPPTNMAPVVIDEITVIGSRCGPFPAALEALRTKRIDVASLIDGEYPLERGLEALERAGSVGTLKILLSIGSDSA